MSKAIDLVAQGHLHDASRLVIEFLIELEVNLGVDYEYE